MKSGRSISLDLEVWLAVDKYKKKQGISDISSAVEFLLKKKLKELGELK